jgi:hypothetical protein
MIEGNWHQIIGPNGMCECGTKNGNCNARLEKWHLAEIALAEARGEKRATRAQNESMIALLKEHGREDLIEAAAKELETARHNKPSN